jgi:DNA polymerase-3 subunit beta
MHFIIQKEDIYNGLNNVIKATVSRGVQPVLSNVLIETIDENKIKLCATDLDISIEIKLNANIEKNGSITLPAKKLFEIIAKLPNKPVEFNLNNENNLTLIKCENSKFEIIGISATEFPPIMYPVSGESIEIEVNTFLNCIKKTVFATANYDTNNVLSGVFLSINNDKLEMAATDGNRLSRIIENIRNTDNKEYLIIIPSKTLAEFSRIVAGSGEEKVLITVKNGQIAFKLDNKIITSRLLEGNYPKYQQLIPSGYEIAAVSEKDILIAALERTATMVNERTSIVKFLFTENKLSLSADTPDLGDSQDEFIVDYKGDELKIAFNYKYILDALKVMDSEKIKIELGGPLSSALLKQDGNENFLNLIMPVQVR